MNFKSQFAEYLFDMKFLHSKNFNDPRSNANSKNVGLIKAIICSGLYPNVAKIDVRRGQYPVAKTLEDGRVTIHPKSVNSNEREFEYPYVVYHKKMKTHAVNLYDCTMISPSPLIFFGGKLGYLPKQKVCDVDGRVQCRCEESDFLIVRVNISILLVKFTV